MAESDSAKPAGARVEPDSRKTEERARQFVGSLSEEEIMLVRLRDELYDGRWDTMLADLRDRLQGKPYVFRLAHPIQDDIDRIERLNRFERQHGINLAKFIE